MINQPTALSDDLNILPRLPAWLTFQRAETFDDVAFRSGAALTVLDQLVSDPKRSVPVNLQANHLALKAATATSRLEGLAREQDIRDAYHIASLGEARGPDGDLLAFWREAAKLRLNSTDWRAGLEGFVGPSFEDDIEGWIDAGVADAKTHRPLAGSVSVMRVVLEVNDRAERVACLLADVVLARALNWASVLPLAAQRLTKAILRDLVADEQGAGLTAQAWILPSVEETT